VSWVTRVIGGGVTSGWNNPPAARGRAAGSYGERVGRLGVLAFLAILVVSGCEAFASDINRGPNVARLVNDLDVTVRLRLCSDNDCATGFSPPDGSLAPGEDGEVNVSSRGVPAVYLVESPDESIRYGCLPLVSPESRPTVSVMVSEHTVCRSDLSEDQFWPSRWADPKAG
jgi:hypothetical protein